MIVSSSQYGYPAAVLAKSLLDLWLSGDYYRLRLALEDVSLAPVPLTTNDERDRIELLRGMASRMKESSDLFTPRRESPRAGTWLDLLHHLSVASSPASLST